MILIELTYKAPLEKIDAELQSHAAFLEENYAKGHFIISGRKNPRTGGMILTALKSIPEAEAMIKRDPFFIHDLADYRLIEFIPTQFHSSLAPFMSDHRP